MRREKIRAAIKKHGLITISQMHEMDPGISRKGWAAAFDDERNDQWIKPHPLQGPEHYFLFTWSGCVAEGVHTRRSRPYGAQALVTRYAKLLYSVRKGVEPIPREHLEKNAPELLVRGLSADSYVALPDDTIGLLLPDCGSDRRHLARKVRKNFERRANASPAWKEIIRLHGFRVIAILGNEEKAKRLRKILKNFDGQFEAVAFEELGRLIQ